MNLHENQELFAELLIAASQPEERGGLGIRQAFLEKDYWVTRSLQLLAEDQARFKEPEGWQQKRIGDSPLLADFEGLWLDLSKVYEAELPGLAYRPVPDAAIVAESIAQVLDVVRKVEGCLE